jgi:sugar lactone lactonase YvrE
MDGKRQKGRTAVAEKFPFGYPDGARDAEGLAVHPKTGDIYIISKEDSGKSGVYRFPKPLMRDRRCTLEKIGTIVFTNPLRMRGRNVGKLATAADISPDGRRLVVRTYTEGYEFSIPENGDVAAALKGTPKKLMMPWLGQFEALCFSADGRTLFTAAEESPCTIWAARY